MIVAWMFPGQGTQKPRLGEQLFSDFATARDILIRASDICGHDLVSLRERGPQIRLDQPQIAEPLICATQCAYVALLQCAHIHPDFVFGYSAGEVAALYAAGCLSLEDALQAAHIRGRILQSYCQPDVRMVVAQGLPITAVRECLKAIPEVCVAGFNGHDHCTLVGDVNLMQKATTLLRARGADLAEVNVSGPWHTPKLEAAAREIESELSCLNFKPPSCPLFTSATGATENDPSMLRRQLAQQIALPVLWQPVMETWWSSNIRTVWEIGPGQLLGMLRRMWTDYRSYSAMSLETSTGKAGRFSRLLNSSCDSH